jgi:DNA segregation ATPase FtsK/SpoIIIE, S-DNA-T family
VCIYLRSSKEPCPDNWRESALASTVPSNRVAWRLKLLLAGVALVAGIATGCSTGGHPSSPPASRRGSSTTAATPSPTEPGPQASGSRTVLSPIGLNVRAAPSASAAVLGSAAQGVVLTVLGYTSSGGGWFKVKGATVTGWISAQPTLSAAGDYRFYSSSQFSALYPATWTESALSGSTSPPTTSAPTTSVPTQSATTTATPVAPSSVVFRPASGPGDIVVTSAGSISQLPQGRPGYGRKSVSQLVTCGITAGLVVFQQTGSASSTTSPAASAPESLTYLAQVRFEVDNLHALGLYADMPDLGATFQIFQGFIASMTFTAPQCSG